MALTVAPSTSAAARPQPTDTTSSTDVRSAASRPATDAASTRAAATTRDSLVDDSTLPAERARTRDFVDANGGGDGDGVGVILRPAVLRGGLTRGLADAESTRQATTGDTRTPAATPAATPSTRPEAATTTTATTPAATPAATPATTPAATPATTPATTSTAAQQLEAVDFNRMTTDQQYDYLRNLTVAQAGGDESAWKDGNNEVNVVGIRGFQDGKAVDNEANKYNDTVFLCRMVDGKKEVYAFDATVDAGLVDNAAQKGYAAKQTVANANGQGTHVETLGVTHLADGFYRNAFGVGKVTGNEDGLRQTGVVRVNFDKNNDGLISDDERAGYQDRGYLAGPKWQVQFHRGTNNDEVGATSLGCQAIRADQYDQFQSIINQAPKNQKFSYALVDGSKLPAADGEFKPAAVDHKLEDLNGQKNNTVFWNFSYALSIGGLGISLNENVSVGFDPTSNNCGNSIKRKVWDGENWVDDTGGVGIIQVPLTGSSSVWLSFYASFVPKYSYS